MKKGIVLGIVFLVISVSVVSSTDTLIKDIHNYSNSCDTIDVSKEILNRGNIAYGLGHGDDEQGIFYFDLDDPSNITWLFPGSIFFAAGGGTWSCNGEWYVCEYNTGSLWIIDLDTGDMVNIGGGGTSCNDLAWDPINNRLYGIGSGGLYEYNPETGEQEFIGSTGISDAIICLVIDSDGVAWGIDVKFSGNSKLYNIDLETGEATEYCDLGMNLLYSTFGHFDYDTNILYIINQNKLLKLFDGEPTLVGHFEGVEIYGFVIPFECYQYTTHEPIYIHGNENFTIQNGVTGGSGTSNDPYIIKKWVIRASSQDGIVIRNTTAFFEIKDCYIHQGKDSYDGIVFYNVTNGVIEKNIITENRNGVMFRTQENGKENSEYNIIRNNSITNNSNDGIHFEHTGYGYHNNNTIAHNILLNNSKGIYLIMSESNLIVSNNIISNNEVGIMLDMCEGGGEFNRIHHNNFVNNVVKQAYELGGPINTWDHGYPSGGNYWSDYTGEDNDGDGIGDTPYEIPEGINEDRYPLMDPWGGLNLPPNKPSINGPISGKPGVEYDYSFVTHDPDDDDVKYVIDWYTTGEFIETAWYESGEKIILPHTWQKGTFIISARAIDSYGGESEWGTLTVTIPRYKSTDNILFWRLLERFPLFQRLLDVWRSNVL
jgi:parallel beta-helix repeat protein